jgi:hypothetical protein
MECFAFCWAAVASYEVIEPLTGPDPQNAKPVLTSLVNRYLYDRPGRDAKALPTEPDRPTTEGWPIHQAVGVHVGSPTRAIFTRSLRPERWNFTVRLIHRAAEAELACDEGPSSL